MKKLVYIVFLFPLLVIMGCAASSGGLTVLDEAVGTNVMVIGNVIVENIDQEFAFEIWDLNFEVVIIGRGADGTLSMHTVPADNRGYYCLPNVPPGQYELKGLILPVPGARPLKIVNNLNTYNSPFYRYRYPERPIEETAEWLPLRQSGRIINFGIKWFGLRTAQIEDMDVNAIGTIILREYSDSIRSERMYNEGYPHSRVNPLEFFKEKFPDSGWWIL